MDYPSLDGPAPPVAGTGRVGVLTIDVATEPPASALLDVRRLAKSFQGLQALSDYELRLPALAIHGVIGPNGAGKTTLFNLLSGFLRPSRGTIAYDGVDITGRQAWQVARLGVRRTFQNIRLFGDLSVLDNVKVALQRGASRSLLGTLLASPGFRRTERELDVRATELLERFRLADRRHQLARHLPYGDQRRLEIARAVGTTPRILLLDEPNAGMNPFETQDLLRLIRSLRDELGITVVLVAHDIPLVMNLCDRVQVLNHGRLIAEGDPAAVRANPDVIAAYLGKPRDG